MAALLAALALLTAPALSQDLLQKRNSSPLDAEATSSALDPWETPTAGFFIRSHHGVPSVDPSSWVVVIDGLVEKPLRLTLKDLEALPEKSLHAVLECSGNGRGLQRPRAAGVQWERGAVGNAQWSGPALAGILRRAGVKPTARFARVWGADDPALPSVPPFVRSVPIEKLLKEDTVLALKMNREPIAVLHGGPVRLVLPGWYGQNWTKWLTHITLTEGEDPGFYMKKAYRMPKAPVKPGEPWDSATGEAITELRVQSFIVRPAAGQEVGLGELEVRGKAFSAAPIAKVEVSSDQGKTWKEAQLESPHPGGGWQEFRSSVLVRTPGEITLMSRATDAAGHTQPLEPDWNPGSYLRNAVDAVLVKASQAPRPPSGRELVQSRCLICHSRELIESQRLSPEAWAKIVSKMEGFGAKFAPDERSAALAYLSSFSPELPPAAAAPADFAVESALFSREGEVPGKAARGAPVYAARCASCHGKDGQGDSGPRLKDRAIARGAFWFTVINGRRSMPSYGDVLTRREIADVRSFLLGP